VECLDLNPLDVHLVCSGGYDGTLKIWNVNVPLPAESIEDSVKKLKSSEKELEASSSTRIHSEAISKLIWIRPETILSGSQDHSIKFYDVNQNKEYFHINCKDNVVSGLTYHDNIIVSSHEDGFIKVWDERSKTNQPIKIVRAHNKWISDVKFHPDGLIFITGSYDSSAKIWDMRSSFPLCTFKDQHDKIFAVEWNGNNTFVVGGSSSKVMVYDFIQSV